jgi:hypothetical protein
MQEVVLTEERINISQKVHLHDRDWVMNPPMTGPTAGPGNVKSYLTEGGKGGTCEWTEDVPSHYPGAFNGTVHVTNSSSSVGDTGTSKEP